MSNKNFKISINSNLTDEQKVVIYEETIRAMVEIITHSGADDSDILEMPIEQWIGREYNRQKYK